MIFQLFSVILYKLALKHNSIMGTTILRLYTSSSIFLVWLILCNLYFSVITYFLLCALPLNNHEIYNSIVCPCSSSCRWIACVLVSVLSSLSACMCSYQFNKCTHARNCDPDPFQACPKIERIRDKNENRESKLRISILRNYWTSVRPIIDTKMEIPMGV